MGADDPFVLGPLEANIQAGRGARTIFDEDHLVGRTGFQARRRQQVRAQDGIVRDAGHKCHEGFVVLGRLDVLQRPAQDDVLVDVELIHGPGPVQAQIIQQWPGGRGQPAGTGQANGIQQARLIAGIQKELEDGRAREEPQVGGVEQAGGCVLKITAEQRCQERVVLKIGDRGERHSAGCQEASEPPQHRLGIDEVLQDVAEQEAIKAVQLQRRVVHGDVEAENPIDALGSAGGHVGLALDAENGAVRPAVLESGAKLSLGAADLEDLTGRGRDSPQN